MSGSNQKRFLVFLSCAVLFLVLADIAGKISTLYFGHDYVGGLIPLFNLNTEGNIPTWFSSTLLLIAAYLLWSIGTDTASHQGPYARHWKILACIFIYLSMDEASSIHEHFSPWLRGLWHTSGLFYFAWVIPALIVVVGLLIGYAGFLMHLPETTKILFILAGLIYVGSALGLECAEGLIANTVGRDHFYYSAILTLEEAVELAGVLIFIYALMAYRAKLLFKGETHA